MRRMVVVLVLAVAGSVPAVAATAEERIPETLAERRPVGAGAVETGFPIDYLGVVWPTPHAGAGHGHDHADHGHDRPPQGAVRFRRGGAWGPWTPFVEDGAQVDGQWASGLVPGGDADAYQVRGVPHRRARVVVLNTTDGPAREIRSRPIASADALPSCLSRHDWGADETLGSPGRSFAPVQVLTVHHTATVNDDPDPLATVRAIHRYHTVDRGFDDIGYQYLIDRFGRLYEGRASDGPSQACRDDPDGDGTFGDGTDFAHDSAGEAVVGAHVGGYNTGNVGIALLGTFTDVAPPAAARQALVATLGELTARHGLDPEGTVDYDNGVNATQAAAISGHRDFGATECPGGLLYDDLPAIRHEVATAVGRERPVAAPAPPPEAHPQPPPPADDRVARCDGFRAMRCWILALADARAEGGRDTQGPPGTCRCPEPGRLVGTRGSRGAR